MSDLPSYIKAYDGFTEVEVDLLIESLCKSLNSIKEVHRFIGRRIVELEYDDRIRGLDDFERDSLREWKKIEERFIRFKNSYNRQYYGSI
jgi:hypothetical protein